MNVYSQAMRLASLYWFKSKVPKAPLPRKLESWDEFFRLMETINVPADFMADRQDMSPQERNIVS